MCQGMPQNFLDHTTWFSDRRYVTACGMDALFSFLRKLEHVVMKAYCSCRSFSDSQNIVRLHLGMETVGAGKLAILRDPAIHI